MLTAQSPNLMATASELMSGRQTLHEVTVHFLKPAALSRFRVQSSWKVVEEAGLNYECNYEGLVVRR